MRAARLLLVFVAAKIAMAAGHPIPFSVWTPFAYFWQDVAAAALFAGLETLLPKPAARALYWTMAGYAAINVSVARAVSSPLTWPMLRAARGPLADSFRVYLTWENLALMAMIAGAAAVPLKMPSWRVAAAVTAPMLVLGPIGSSKIETLGLNRNPVLALLSLPHPPRAFASGGDWRISHLADAPAEDLSPLRGIARGKNIVLISLESTAAEYLSLFGGRDNLTPRLSELARNGVLFENAYAVYPESIKGLYSVLCSEFPKPDTRPEAYEHTSCRGLPAQLAAAGYRTALFHSGRFAYLGMESVIRGRGYQTLEDAGDIGGNHESSFGVDEPATVARMLAWIDGLPRGQRFFLNYLPIAGHHPYETPAPGPFPERDEFGRYRNSVLYGDAALGDLIDGLAARGLSRDTVWIVYGDHGEAFGQHDGNFAHTFFLYEENVHVPLLIAAPGAIPDRIRVDKVVSLVDVAPTMLDLAGVNSPQEYQGRSLLGGIPEVALFFTDYSLRLAGVRDGKWKFIREDGSGRSKLFDLARDPEERVNVAGANRELAGHYADIVRKSGY